MVHSKHNDYIRGVRMNMFMKIGSLFGEEKWSLVKVIEEHIQEDIDTSPITIQFRLYESNKGNRRVRFSCGIMKNEEMGNLVKHGFVYGSQVQPWLSGKDSFDIPSYKMRRR
jgi:hypothetical protein